MKSKRTVDVRADLAELARVGPWFPELTLRRERAKQKAPKKTRKRTTRARSAVTGKWVTKAAAKAKPREHVRERVERRAKPRAKPQYTGIEQAILTKIRDMERQRVLRLIDKTLARVAKAKPLLHTDSAVYAYGRQVLDELRRQVESGEEP